MNVIEQQLEFLLIQSRYMPCINKPDIDTSTIDDNTKYLVDYKKLAF